MRNVPLKLVHVVALPPAAVGDGYAIAAVAECERLQEDHARHFIAQAHKVAVEAAAPDRAPYVTTEVLNAPIIPTLVELSRHADVVVVGCRGQGVVARTLLGSVSSGLAHHAHCPIAVIHDEDPQLTHSPQAPVVVGIDGSPASEPATEIAFDEASRRGAELVALHAWSDLGPLDFPSVNWAPIDWTSVQNREEEILAERLSGWCERYPDVVRKVVVCDQPARRLLDQARQAQLVVVGSHGRGGFPGMLLGSVSTSVVNSAHTPVIIARGPQHS